MFDLEKFRTGDYDLHLPTQEIYNLDINEYEKGGTNMNEKMKRDLIKLLFEKEYSDYERAGMYSYKGRIITDYLHRTARFIDFIDKIKDDYGIKGHEVAEIIIEEFDLKEYKEEE